MQGPRADVKCPSHGGASFTGFRRRGAWVDQPQQKLENNDNTGLDLLLRSVVDYAIYMLDADGYVRSWNTGGEQIKGYTASEIVGQHFSRFYTSEDVASGLPELGLRTAREEGRFAAEGWRVRKDGSRFRASVVIDPVHEDGHLVDFAKVTRDITERYHAEQQLEEAREALLESRKMESIGKLTLGLAHDFNNLITIIVNGLELIDRQPGADARTRWWIRRCRPATVARC